MRSSGFMVSGVRLLGGGGVSGGAADLCFEVSGGAAVGGGVSGGAADLGFEVSGGVAVGGRSVERCGRFGFVVGVARLLEGGVPEGAAVLWLGLRCGVLFRVGTCLSEAGFLSSDKGGGPLRFGTGGDSVHREKKYGSNRCRILEF